MTQQIIIGFTVYMHYTLNIPECERLLYSFVCTNVAERLALTSLSSRWSSTPMLKKTAHDIE